MPLGNTTRAGSKRVDSVDDLAEVVARIRAEGRSIALTNGCYDLLHVGHLRSLAGAKAEADVLIVALNSDASVGKWKGAGYPVVPEDERAEMVAGFACVDYVYVFGDASVDNLLDLIRPDAYCKGPEYTMENLPEAETVRRLEIRFCTVGDPKEHSSTDIATRIAEAHAQRPQAGDGRHVGDAACADEPVHILSRRRVFDGFLNLDEVRLRHALPEGGVSGDMIRLNVERGDGAAALVVNTERDTVVLTRQFRFAAWERGQGDPRGWILEIPAGTVAIDADPEAVARSEVAEEVGYRAKTLTPLASFLASPGTTTERVILYEADVTDADRLPRGGGGLAHEHEYIEVVEMPVTEALARLEAGAFADAKSVIALQALAARRAINVGGSSSDGHAAAL